MTLKPLGEAAYLVEDISVPAHELARRLNEAKPAGLVEAVAAYETVGLYVDPSSFVETCLEPFAEFETVAVTGKLVEIPCRYDGPDLEEVAIRLGLEAEDVVRLHTSVEYTCYAIGFCPGFPYLGYLDDRLTLPRREQPRQHVPAGSVAIAGSQTGIYPLDRPGGWWLIGSTEFRLVDLEARYFALQAGDRVRFRPM